VAGLNNKQYTVLPVQGLVSNRGWYQARDHIIGHDVAF